MLVFNLQKGGIRDDTSHRVDQYLRVVARGYSDDKHPLVEDNPEADRRTVGVAEKVEFEPSINDFAEDSAEGEVHHGVKQAALVLDDSVSEGGEAEPQGNGGRMEQRNKQLPPLILNLIMMADVRTDALKQISSRNSYGML